MQRALRSRENLLAEVGDDLADIIVHEGTEGLGGTASPVRRDPALVNEAADNLRDFIRTTVPMKEYQDLLQKLKLPDGLDRTRRPHLR